MLTLFDVGSWQIVSKSVEVDIGYGRTEGLLFLSAFEFTVEYLPDSVTLLRTNL
jgi:hypothetical protein